MKKVIMILFLVLSTMGAWANTDSSYGRLYQYDDGSTYQLLERASGRIRFQIVSGEIYNVRGPENTVHVIQERRILRRFRNLTIKVINIELDKPAHQTPGIIRYINNNSDQLSVDHAYGDYHLDNDAKSILNILSKTRKSDPSQIFESHFLGFCSETTQADGKAKRNFAVRLGRI